jgi:predicted RND superfamily exporter protein
VRYFGENQVMRQHLDFVNERIAGAGAIDFSIGAGDGEGIFEPGYMRNLDAFGAWLRTQPHVVHVDTVADIVKRLNKTWSGDAQAAYAVPEDRRIIAQLLLTYEFSLEPGLGTDNIITFDKDATRVRVQLDDTSGAAHIELDRRAQAWLVANAPPAMHAEGASAPLMFAHIGERSIRGILYGLVGSLLIMSLLLVALFRSVRLGVMSLVSNVLPVGMAFGAWGLMHGRVDVGLSVTLGIAFGIVVDDTIHFLTKYQRARAELGLEPEHAIRYAFRTVGRAIAITSIVLVAGFSMLGMSDMNITSNTSILTTITVAFAFSIDFFLVPSLLLLIDRPSPAIARAAAADAAAAQPA